LAPPFVKVDPCIRFQYTKLQGSASSSATALRNNHGNNLKLSGDFGQFIYQKDRVFTASEISFHAPAEHTVRFGLLKIIKIGLQHLSQIPLGDADRAH
jgi:hypothetical protein